MKIKPGMNVDVDLVVVDPMPAWFAWFKENSRDNIEFNLDWHKESYNLERTMAKYMDIDPYDFWRNKKLYDDMTPMANAPLVLKKLSKIYNIRFVTQSTKQSELSKKMFLLRHFDFKFEIHNCKSEDKWEFWSTVWVEDKISTLDSLVQAIPDCKVFHMINDINKNFEVYGAIRVQNWTEIGRRLL